MLNTAIPDVEILNWIWGEIWHRLVGQAFDTTSQFQDGGVISRKKVLPPGE